jgi:hypothetical protein
MTGKSEELMEKREKAMTEMLACLGVIAEGKFTGDVPSRMAGICIQEMHRLLVGQELPSVLSARKAYATAGKATSALIEIRKHADETQKHFLLNLQTVHVLAIHGQVDRVLGPRKVN